MEGFGHINGCHGLAERLRDRGHRVVFAIDKKFAGRLAPHGFEEEHMYSENSELPPGAVDPIFIMLNENGLLFAQEPIKVVEFCANAFVAMMGEVRQKDTQYKAVLDKVKPDVIVIDSYMSSPVLMKSGIPWVWLYSAGPLGTFNNDNLPPGWLGLPTNDGREKWTQLKIQIESIWKDLHKDVNEWMVSEGVDPLPSESNRFLHHFSKHLNIYMTPKELDYKELQPLAHNWHRVDGFVRTTHDTFEIPECLRNRQGKLVLLSMGSLGCAIVELMVRLTTILGKSKHRFIVNTGPLHDKYSLPDNMWGQPFLPQTAILPLVDLVLTHGGNNTVTETFYFGKPMLVLPLWADQYDNAQRLQESGLGLRLDPFRCTEEELLTSIDKLVNDSNLAQRMESIGDRIRDNNDKQIIAKRFEDLFIRNN
ncbi:unnamed protein product [Medioppia subpectinata]|uniref:UDP-glucuronosyltransferase n=1 Tax=Medioppia subpectinata TaxID=1979941 RepID=A0A7R9LJ69_9ACAR|nr:unnamed protein product [Medioppia subpectinata]CAG2119292.1 unnamed protein product [Medioppia subpectinata]